MASLLDLLQERPLESNPDYDPYGMQAAAIRRRYPTRGPGIAPRLASEGRTAEADPEEARQQAYNVYANEDYNPASLLQMAMGTARGPAVLSRMRNTLQPPLALPRRRQAEAY